MNERFPSIPLTRKDIARNRKIDWELCDDAFIAQLAFHGAKQKANDGLGSKEMTNEERVAVFNKVCDAIQNGVWGVGRESDPVEREVKTIARQLANKWARENIPNVKVVELPDNKDYNAAYDLALKNPKVRALAEKRVADLAELEELD